MGREFICPIKINLPFASWTLVTGYFNNLVLADRTLGQLRLALENVRRVGHQLDYRERRPFLAIFTRL